MSRELRVSILWTLCSISAIVLLYSVSWHGDFIYDDQPFISWNSAVSTGVPWWRYFTDADTISNQGNFGIYRPLRTLSFRADALLWGLRPVGFHLTNIFWHMVNACLLVVVIRQRATSWNVIVPKTEHVIGLLVLLWSVHPIHTETVSWIASRGDLMALAGMLGVCCCMPQQAGKGVFPIRWSMITLCSIGALLSKESAVMLPMLLLGDQWWCGAKRVGRRWWALWWWIAGLTVLYLIIRGSVMSDWAQRAYWGGHPLTTVWNVLSTIPVYARLWCWPTNLHLLYYTPSLVDPWHVSVGLGATIIIVVVTLWWCARQRRPAIAWGLWWVCWAFLPTANIVPIKGLISEHFWYIPSVGCVAIGAWIGAQGVRWMRGRRGLQYIAEAMLVVLLGVAAAGTAIRNVDWSDRLYLWSQTFKANPHSHEAVHNLALEAHRRGHFEIAQDAFAKAQELHSDNGSTVWGLGIALVAVGELDQGTSMLRKAVELDPQLAGAWNSLGSALLLQGQLEAAEDAVHRSLSLRVVPEAHYNLGLILAARGDVAAAETNMRVALELGARQVEVLTSLGSLLQQQECYDEAVRVYEQLLAQQPMHAAAHLQLGRVLWSQGKLAAARTAWIRARQLDSDQVGEDASRLLNQTAVREE